METSPLQLKPCSKCSGPVTFWYLTDLDADPVHGSVSSDQYIFD